MLIRTIYTALLLVSAAPLPAVDISEKNLRFVEYPDFPDAHSTWGSIGYSAKHQKVFVGVTNHRDREGIVEYDVRTGEIRLRGFLDQLANLRDYQWQGKVHTKLTEGPDGAMYFATDGGESREEYLMDHPHGYGGGFFFRWDPATNELTNLGMGLQYDSIKDVEVDQVDGKIYAVSYPQVRFLVYDFKKNDLRDLGRLGSDHVPRIMFHDWWSNIYYVDWRQRLVKYEREAGKIIFAQESLPAFPGTPGERIITGIKSYAIDRPNGVIYFATYGSKMVAFYPQKNGIGRWEDLGGVYDQPGRPPYNYYAPNLALGRNGKLYYFLGGHGMYAGEKPNVTLMEFDPKKRTKRVVLRFPLDVITEVTGCDVKDENGTMYFAGRRDDRRARQMGESGASRPFLLMFNPEKEIR